MNNKLYERVAKMGGLQYKRLSSVMYDKVS